MRVLWRAFLVQFFTSETVTSDVRLHQAMIGVLAFLLPPGVFLLVQVFPAFELTAISSLSVSTVSSPGWRSYSSRIRW